MNSVNPTIMKIMVPSLREEIIFVGNAVEGIKGAVSWVKGVAVSAWDSVAGAVGSVVGVVEMENSFPTPMESRIPRVMENSFPKLI